MAKCDLCDSSCNALDLVQLRDSYQVDDIREVCPTCRKWADSELDEIRKETVPKLRARIYAMKHSVTVTNNQCLHLNGWYMTAKFWVFHRRYFVCSDCGEAIQVKGK